MQDELLDDVARAWVREPGAPLARVAELSGVGRATLYRHFTSRDDLMRTLALRSIEAIDEACAGLESEVPTAVAYVEAMFQRLTPLGHRYHFLSREGALLEDRRIARELRRQHAELGELVDALRAEGACAPAAPRDWVIASMDALIYAAWTTASQANVPTEDVARWAARTLLRGIAPDPEA